MAFNILNEYLSSRRNWQLVLVSFGLIALIAVLDLLTGSEISFSFFYLIPIIFSSWYIGKTAGYVICFSSAMAWFAIDYTSGQAYTQEWIHFWNGSTRLLLFLTVTYLFLSLKETLLLKEELLRIDTLTGVKSLRAFMEDAGIALKSAARHNYPVALGFIDLDNFKLLNDTAGHAAGNEALRVTGEQLNRIIRSGDITARIGGDEFVVMLQHTDETGAREFFKKLHERLVDSMNTMLLPVGFTIGVAIIDDGTTDLQQALDRADALMLEMKKLRKNSIAYRVYRAPHGTK